MNEISLLLSVKEMFENEISTANLQRELLVKDFTTLQEEHDALKAAYHSLSYETATAATAHAKAKAMDHSSLEALEKANAKVTELIQKLELSTNQSQEQRQKIIYLENELNNMKLSTNSAKSLENYAILVSELEGKIRALEIEKLKLENLRDTQAMENKQYQTMIDKLKDKIRDLSMKSSSSAAGKSGGNNNEFFDTFEEVMKEEMMTMKMAFEAKLKAAKDEADALSKKHQQEIQRIQTSSSPFNSLKR
jgi:hypothetical protein